MSFAIYLRSRMAGLVQSGSGSSMSQICCGIGEDKKDGRNMSEKANGGLSETNLNFLRPNQTVKRDTQMAISAPRTSHT